MPPAPEQACLCCALTKDLFTRSPLVTVASSWLARPSNPEPDSASGWTQCKMQAAPAASKTKER